MADVEMTQIEDLASPILTGVQQAALDHGEHTPVVKSVKAVVSAAVDRTGLENSGADDFHERLALWLSEVDEYPEGTGTSTKWQAS